MTPAAAPGACASTDSANTRARARLLSAQAVRMFAEHNLKYPGSILGELYEDKYVSDVLRGNGVEPFHCVLAGVNVDEVHPDV